MPSDRRLHPTTVLFSLVEQARWLVVPVLFALVATRSAAWQWDLWLLVLLVPYAIASVGRYLTFRYRLDADELVMKRGLLFRNERHVPWARIQNLDAAQNVFHRMFGVVAVKIETGGGDEPEAKLSVVPVEILEELRRRVLTVRGPGRAAASAGTGGAAAGEGREGSLAAGAPLAGASAPGRTLLRLPLRELLLCGFIRNRGVILIAAGFGLLWEIGVMDGLLERFIDQPDWGSGLVRDLAGALVGEQPFPLRRIALALVGLAALLVLIRPISMVYETIRLHGFVLERLGDDLRAEFGLFTRVTATIPLRRVQSLTIEEGPLQRLFGRAALRVETAGGGSGEEGGSGLTQREWLAPIIPREDVPALVEEVQPGARLETVEWKPVAPRAFGRAFRERLVVAALATIPLTFLLGWRALAPFALFAVIAAVAARFYVRHLGWALNGDAVLFRSGWISRYVTIVRFSRIQAVAMRESPFDRRARMARVLVDTAGAGSAAHRVYIPYLPRPAAVDLCGHLSGRAAETAFQW